MKSPTKARIFTAPRQGWLITCVNSRCSISGQPVYTVDREITGHVPFEWAVRMMGVQGKRLGGCHHFEVAFRVFSVFSFQGA